MEWDRKTEKEKKEMKNKTEKFHFFKNKQQKPSNVMLDYPMLQLQTPRTMMLRLRSSPTASKAHKS